jgi:hypothetical protein
MPGRWKRWDAARVSDADAMINQKLLQGLFLIAVSLVFGVGAFNYRIGTLGAAGPGLFPLLVSSLVLLLAIAITTRALLTERVPFRFNVKNVALIMASLIGFALISERVNMIAGIVFLVFCSSFAGTSYSVKRNAFIAVGLVAIAFAMQELLGLQLRLY